MNCRCRFTVDKLRTAIRALKIGKACGPYKIVSEVFRDTDETAPQCVLDVMNRLFESKF